MKDLFLIRAWKENKILFCSIIVYLFFQFYFIQKRVHSFPWFVWDMYSREETLPDTIVQTEIFLDGERLDVTHIPIWQEATILHTYKMYNWQKMNGDQDPMDEVVKTRTAIFPKRVYYYAAYKVKNHAEENNTYPLWLKHYIEDRTGKKYHTVELKDIQYKYEHGKFRQVDGWTVLKIEE